MKFKKTVNKFTLEEIREAVDIVIGDDGFRSAEVIQTLKTCFRPMKTVEIDGEELFEYLQKRFQYTPMQAYVIMSDHNKDCSFLENHPHYSIVGNGIAIKDG